MKVALLESRCCFFPPDFIKIRSVVLVGIVVFVGMVFCWFYAVCIVVAVVVADEDIVVVIQIAE